MVFWKKKKKKKEENFFLKKNPNKKISTKNEKKKVLKKNFKFFFLSKNINIRDFESLGWKIKRLRKFGSSDHQRSKINGENGYQKSHFSKPLASKF